MTVSSGNLWVAESADGEGQSFSAGRSRVNEFDVSSAFVSPFVSPQINETAEVQELQDGIAVGTVESKQQVYVGASDGLKHGIVAVYEAEGHHKALATWTEAFGESFGIVSGVAADNSSRAKDWAAGDLYVVDFTHNRIDVLRPGPNGSEESQTEIAGVTPGGEPFPAALPSEPFPNGSVGQIAVNSSNGDILIGIPSADAVDVLEPLAAVGEYRTALQLTGTPYAGTFQGIGAVAVDSGDNEIYIAEEGRHIIDEFSETGEYLGDLSAGQSGGFEKIGGMAVDGVSHHLYVGYRRGGVGEIDAYSPDLTVPDVTTGEASQKTPRSGVLNGTVNPRGAGPATCEFAWGPTEALGHFAQCEGAPVEGEVPTEVSAKVSGLEADTPYYYRLAASNGNGTNTGEASETIEKFATTGPGNDGEWAAKVGSNSVTLAASINAGGSETRYFFEYGSTSGYGLLAPSQASTPNGALVGAATEPVEVSQSLTELAAGATYHYRVVVMSNIEVGPGELEWQRFEGPDQTFTTQVGTGQVGLLDGREWEMVSPSDKHGALVLPIAEAGVVQASSDGSAFTFLANAPSEEQPKGYVNHMQVFAQRGLDGGWSSSDIETPQARSTGLTLGIGYEYRFFSSDLSQAVLEPQGPFTRIVGQEKAPEATERTVYRRANYGCAEDVTPCYTPLVTSANTPVGTRIEGNSLRDAQGEVAFDGASADASHVVVKSSVALTATPGSRGGLYEWAEGQLKMVSVRPPSEEGPSAIGTLGYEEVASGYSVARNAISSDGAQVVWGEEPENKERRLYVWEAASGESVRIDIPEGIPASGIAEPEFQAASSDGSRVFFTDSQALVPGARGRDLYVCAIVVIAGRVSCTLSDVADNVDGSIPGVSANGAYVYFVAEDRLYVAYESEGVWSVPRLIAALSSHDSSDWAEQDGLGGTLTKLSASVSPNGEFVAFMSQAALTAYNNLDAASGAPDQEVYVYDVMSRRLVCASCDPSGVRPVGVTLARFGEEHLFEGYEVFGSGTIFAGNVPGWTPYRVKESLYQSRYLLNNGRLFFDSAEPLVPQDGNGTVDVYELEPVGVGSCSEGSAGFVGRDDGCVGLVSSGVSGEESVFLDASESGADVFFLTGERLVATDRDDNRDVYDAHECTAASPCLPVSMVAPPACASGDACKAGPASQPTIFGPPASTTFSGAGNVHGVAKPKTEVTTRPEKLARALKVCATKPKRKRPVCVREARKRYGRLRRNRGKKAGVR